MITKAQEVQWKEHPVTKELFIKLEEIKKYYESKWSLYTILSKKDQDQLLIEAARDFGTVDAINVILEAELADERISDSSDISD